MLDIRLGDCREVMAGMEPASIDAIVTDPPYGLGFMGKGLRTVLNPDVWSDVEGTFVGARVDENWQALFRTARLFRETAQAVAAELGYRYPAELDRSVMAYLVGIKDLERLETSS